MGCAIVKRWGFTGERAVEKPGAVTPIIVSLCLAKRPYLKSFPGSPPPCDRQVLHPNHYLVVDHAHRAVVLSICGTSNTADLPGLPIPPPPSLPHSPLPRTPACAGRQEKQPPDRRNDHTLPPIPIGGGGGRAPTLRTSGANYRKFDCNHCG